MAKFVSIIVWALCCVFGRTISAPIIKASGVQWSEPKGTGKGNITLIMIPQNNSGGNDTDMIVAVKSDYQIVSQDTQLLNLIVNENVTNRTNSSKFDTPLRKCSSLKENNANKPERELLGHPNTAKYFEPESKLVSSENTTNNTVNVYPLPARNDQNLVSLNDTSTTISNTVNIFQFLNMSESYNKHDNSSSGIVPSNSHPNTSKSKHNSFNLTEPNNHSFIQDNFAKSKSDNISLSMLGPDDNFLNEALNILETLKQDPSYYNKLKSNQIPSTEEIKEHGDTSLIDSKTKFLKSDDSALASDEGEGFLREFGRINHENQEISNLEGSGHENSPSSTCLPFFMSLTSEQSTTQLSDTNNPKEISLEKVPLSGTGSNVSQELLIRGNTSSSDPKSTCITTLKPLASNNALQEVSQTTTAPVEGYQSINVGYGVQSNDSQTMSVTTCKPSNGFYTESTNLTPLTIATSKPEYGAGAVTITNLSTGEPNYLQQTLAAGKNIAVGSELNKSDSSSSFDATTSLSVSGYNNYLSTISTECVTTTKSSVILAPPNLEQASKVPSAGMMKSPENQDLTIPQAVTPVTKTDQTDQSLLSRPADLLGGSIPQNVTRQNELETKSTECITNVSLQTVSPIVVVSPTAARNIAGGLNGLAGTQTECATDPNINIKQESSGLPQAGVGAIPKKITLEPQVSCGTMKKEESSTLSRIEGQEALFNSKDLTLPLVQSSIFLANNNEMPNGKDIPISLNASLDEFSLSDLQEKEDRMNGKVAELYNRNPMLYNVEREPTGTLLKPKRKHYKSDILKNPTFYFDKVYKPDANQVLKVNFAGKNVILEQRPSYKAEPDSKICNNTVENNNTLPNYETEPDDSDSMNVKPEPKAITKPQIVVSMKPTVYGGKEQKYIGSTIKHADTQQPENEEENLHTVLDTTTFGIKCDDKSSFALLDVSTSFHNNNMVSIPTPASDDNDIHSQGAGQNNQNGGSEQKYGENMSSQTNKQINLTPKPSPLSQTPHSKSIDKIPGRMCSNPSRTTANNMKTVPDRSKTSLSDETVHDKNTLTTEKINIPADSLQKIVIEIVRHPKKSENKPDSYKVKSSFDTEEGIQSMEENKEKIPYKEMMNIKQNFVPFQSAWKPVQNIENQPVFPMSDSIQPNSVYRNDKIKDSLKTYNSYESDGGQETYLQTLNNNRHFENQDTFKQEQIPTIINESQQTATNHEKSLGANILKLLMADKSIVKSK